MLTEREQETAFLENHYKRPGSQILVVYGQRGVGKTALLTAFTEKKDTICYTAVNSSPREQRYQWGSELRERGCGNKIPQYPSWREILECLAGETVSGKRILLIENFQYLIKGEPLFLQELIAFLKEQRETQLLILLSTFASGWVENSMISKMGNLAFSISGFLKIKELSFSAMCRIFNAYTLWECIDYYAVFGGYPGVWKLLDSRQSVEENLTAIFLQKNSFLPELMMKWLLEELRETAVYNTILAAIAEENRGKLNDLFAHTGFSRAKISVYLKNLMELEIVEKVLPGTYEICNSFVRFYFRFLFPHRTAAEEKNGNTFYEKYIRGEYDDFVQTAYRRICESTLQTNYHTIELWKAKQGKIYLLCRDDAGKKIVVDYSGTVCYTAKDYDMLLEAMKNTRITADAIMIFSENGYEQILTGRISGENVSFLSVNPKK